MLERLRSTVFQSFVEVLLLFPLPWRSCVAVLLLLLLVAILPPGLWLKPFIWLFLQLMRLGLWFALQIQQLAANRGRSGLIDVIDAFLEIIIRGFGYASEFLNTKLALPTNWGRPRKRWIVLLSLLPAALWYVRPFLGDITVGRAIDSGFATLLTVEQWAITGRWKLPESGVDRFVVIYNEPADVPDSISGSDLIHVVKKGESLKSIANQYGVKMQCIIKVNRPRFNNFNPDLLNIGMQLLIPLSDPSCRL